MTKCYQGHGAEPSGYPGSESKSQGYGDQSSTPKVDEVDWLMLTFFWIF